MGEVLGEETWLGEGARVGRRGRMRVGLQEGAGLR